MQHVNAAKVFPRRLTSRGGDIFNNRLLFKNNRLLFSENFVGGGTTTAMNAVYQ